MMKAGKYLPISKANQAEKVGRRSPLTKAYVSSLSCYVHIMMLYLNSCPAKAHSGLVGKTMKRGQIICHGDFGPWNIVWQDDEPVGIVVWDLALPANPEYDILYALEYSAPFRDDDTTIEWHHFPTVPDRRHRIQVFVDAYGRSAIDNVAQRVAQMQRDVGKYEAYLAKRGVQPQVDWVASGDLEKVERRARWTGANKHLFE